MNWALPLYLLLQCLCSFCIKILEEHEKLNCLEMRQHTWYKGNIEPYEANHILLAMTSDGKYAQPDGAFLVRDKNYPVDLTLAVKFGDAVQHIRIYIESSGTYLFWGVHFISVYELVTYYRKYSVSRNDMIRIYLKDMIEMDPEPLSKGEKRYIALYDFEPQECEELLLEKGDEITVIHDNDPYWWRGAKCRTYQVGYFPREYVGKSTR